MIEKKLTLPIQIGKMYVRRDGVITTARSYEDPYAFTKRDKYSREIVQVSNGKKDKYVFVDTGYVNRGREPSPNDLISDYPELEMTVYERIKLINEVRNAEQRHSETLGIKLSTPRPHAELVAKYYSDRTLKCWYWVPTPSTNSGHWFIATSPKWLLEETYFVGHEAPTHNPKPIQKTIEIDGYEFHPPETEKLEKGTIYWVAYLGGSASRAVWENSTRDMSRLNRGVVFLTEQNAIYGAKAMTAHWVKAVK